MYKVIRRRKIPELALLTLMSTLAWAQTTPAPVVTVDQPDAQRTKDQLSSLLDHYPPALKGVLALDPSLLTNQPYLAPYPALTGFLNTHPEVARNPSFYIGQFYDRRGFGQDRASAAIEIWRQVLDGTAAFLAFGMAIGLITWLIRTIIDYRRWNRLASVQAEFHTRILDRFTANDELIAYIQSHAGKRFLESTPIALDAGTRSMAAPLGRILWSVQAGLVLAAAGIGLQLVIGSFSDEAALPLKVMGALGIALGIGFVVSATISFMISSKLGLIEPRPQRPEPRLEPPTP
jgi:hypothetical protein